jgi:uncharacterized protein YkwD
MTTKETTEMNTKNTKATGSSVHGVRSGWKLVAVAALMLGGLGTVPLSQSSATVVAQATADSTADEARFVELINASRTAEGLPALTVEAELVTVGRNWSSQMAAAGEISHNPNFKNDVKSKWRKLGENVGVGPTVGELHEAFMNSPAHRKNIMDPAFTRIGIGLVYSSDGTIYVTEQFMDLAPTATPVVTGATAVQGTSVSSSPPAQLALAEKQPAKKPKAKPKKAKR